MFLYESIHVELLGTVTVLMQSTLVLVHQTVNPWLFSGFFQYILRDQSPCRSKYTWIYVTKIQADTVAIEYAELIQAQAILNVINMVLQNESLLWRCNKNV